MAKDVLHVVPHEEVWGVKREGNERVSSTHGTQKEAIDSARNLAHEGDDIVIHRPDGTIRERVTYTVPSNNGTTPGNNSTTPRPEDVVSVGSRVSWQAILAGLAVAFAVYVCLSLLALAIGISTINHVQSKAFAVTAVLAGLLSLLAALFMGGYMTSRLSTRETKGEAAAYGVILWAAFFFVLLLTGMNLGSSVGQMANLPGPGIEARPAQVTDVGPAQAQVRRDEIRARAEQLMAEMNPVALTWLAFGGMTLSVFAAVGGALTGAGPGLAFRRLFHEEPESRLVVEKPA